MLTTTSTVLLEGLKDGGNHAVWREFDGRYRPVLLAFARRLALGPEDAAEAAQEALVAFAEEYRAGRYERERGRLRSWLFALARARVVGLHRKRDRERDWRGPSALAGVHAGDDDLERIWEEEWSRSILLQALAELRATTDTAPKTLRAFELLALEERPAAEVASELQMSPNAVYLAKHHVLERLRAVLNRLEEDY